MKKILILGLGAFGFAIAKHLGENNPEQIFFASEVNSEIHNAIKKTREHPYFFPGAKLPENIQLVPDSSSILPEVDIIISVIPCQFIGQAFASMKDSLKDGVTIVNLSKGINNDTLQTTSEKLSEVLLQPHPTSPYQGEEKTATSSLLTKEGLEGGINYTYAYLAGGMIAQELVDGKKLGADIVTENKEVGEDLRNLFASDSLDIHLLIGNPKNTELYAALKNIVALILGYYEGQGNAASTLGYYLTRLLKEMKGITILLSQDTSLNSLLTGERKLQTDTTDSLSSQERVRERCENMNFTDYALGGDIIATCFGDSRNRLLGNMLGKGTPIDEALEKLTEQKKIAEGWETFKGIYKITKGKDEFELINSFGEKYLS